MIGDACAQLGERALIVGGITDFEDAPHFDHVKIVSAVSFATILPACCAVVHHGGVGTTIAGMRAGVPSLILWTASDQPIWAAQVRRLGVGSSRRFSATTRTSLVADLSRILAPHRVERAREVAALMTTPADGVAATADLLEEAARLGRSG
jgi:UDP:flavonoid glycosyltransferase YjiC (YdhE family)